MKYRDSKTGEPISVLGYGCMRFSRSGRGIDMEKTEKEIMRAFELGVNYYDTAYIYPGSESALGEILNKNGIRDKVNIATKLPQYMIGNKAAIDKYFDEELKRLRTDHVDYYLMHHMTNIAQWEKLRSLGIEEWIKDKKDKGLIRNVGFSYHGNTENFIKILNEYDWDSCLVQYNYMDENSQAGRAGVEAAHEKGIPVMVMEPLRGGKLVDMLPEKAKSLIANDASGFSAAELSFRWLWDQPGVTCVLSGMNSIEMLEENCRVADEAEVDAMSPEVLELIEKIKEIILETTKVGCTECRYCMPCPKGVDIPAIFRCYNRMFTENKISGQKEYFQTVVLNGTPSYASQCIGCGRCEKHCPQEIKIIDELKNADRALRPFFYKPAYAVAKKFMLRGAKK